MPYPYPSSSREQALESSILHNLEQALEEAEQRLINSELDIQTITEAMQHLNSLDKEANQYGCNTQAIPEYTSRLHRVYQQCAYVPIDYHVRQAILARQENRHSDMATHVEIAHAILEKQGHALSQEQKHNLEQALKNQLFIN